MRTLKLVLLLIPFGPISGQGLSFALKQINGQAIIDQGLTGKGVKIGIIDGGFLSANNSPNLSGHFENNRVKYYKDFITPDLEAYQGSKGMDDGHGTKVWKMIGGVDKASNIQFGLATQSEFYLARTDHFLFEGRKEERFLIEALSEMIDAGVQIVNISLGYTNGYSDKAEDYSIDQIDGKSTWITQAIDSVLVGTNVLVVTSAGNDGNNSWRVLSAPSDSRHVLTVGSSKLKSGEEMNFSSVGPDHLGYIKPEITCFSTSGTSYSSPVITGLAACLLEKQPNMTALELKELIIESCHAFPIPNNYFGHGIPDAQRALRLLNGDKVTYPVKTIIAEDDQINLGKKTSRVTLYHKNDWLVIDKHMLRVKNKLKIRRPKGINRTTVLLGTNENIEIIWN